MKCWCCRQPIDECTCENKDITCNVCELCLRHCTCIQIGEVPGIPPVDHKPITKQSLEITIRETGAPFPVVIRIGETGHAD